MSHEIRILQAARLKGRPTESVLAAAAGLPADAVGAVVGSLIAAGLLDRAGARLKLTAVGRSRLTELLARERSGIDQELLREYYHDFDELNATFKRLVTDWQLVDTIRPNDHADAAYDAAVIQRLGEVDDRLAPLLERLVQIAPRLQPYSNRFATALSKINIGDHSWFARPLIDSYHTVWFELHEELIGLAGLSRAVEAAAGRAE
jgi:hypothetical protein